MPLLSRCALLGSLTLLSLAPVQAVTTLTFQPDNSSAFNGDAFVTTGPSNTLSAKNYGGAGALAVSAALGKGEFRSVLRFDLNPPTIKSAFDAQFGAGLWTIDAVSLTLDVTTPANSIFNGSTTTNTAGQIGIRWLPTDSWVEGTGMPNSPSVTGINYNSLSSSLETGYQQQGTSFSFNPGTTNNASGTFTATFAPSSGLLSDLLSSTSHNQATFELLAADSNVSAVFHSRSFGSNQPILSVHAVAAPEPGRALLLLLGLSATLFRRRRGTTFMSCHPD